jgi:hypothetical protein
MGMGNIVSCSIYEIRYAFEVTYLRVANASGDENVDKQSGASSFDGWVVLLVFLFFGE